MRHQTQVQYGESQSKIILFCTQSMDHLNPHETVSTASMECSPHENPNFGGHTNKITADRHTASQSLIHQPKIPLSIKLVIICIFYIALLDVVVATFPLVVVRCCVFGATFQIEIEACHMESLERNATSPRTLFSHCKNTPPCDTTRCSRTVWHFSRHTTNANCVFGETRK